MKKVVATLLSFLLLVTVASISTVASEQSFGRVDTEGSNLNVRSGPSTGYSILGRMSDGTYFEIVGEENGWYQIVTPTVSGYVSGDYVLPVSHNSVGKVDTEGSRLNVRTGPSTSYASITKLSDGTYFEILSEENGWYQVRLNATTTGWLCATYAVTYDIPEPEPQPQPTPDPVPSNGYIWPAEGPTVITQNFSSGHPATDISYNGTSLSQLGGGTRDVYAANDGVVEYVYTGCTHRKQPYICCNGGTGYGGGGNVVVIRHADGNYTMYAHLDVGQVFVQKGDTVSRGQVIAKMGNTGQCAGATGIHLHFEVREGYNSSAYSVDARNYVNP